MGTAPPLDPSTLAREFCHQCNWAFACWITHRRIFDDNTDKDILNRNAPNFNEHLWRISQTYSYLQICKLHDPARSAGAKSPNLTIRYIIDNLDWGGDKDSVQHSAAKLEELYQHIKPTRNKVIAHNDLDALLQGEPVGEFPEGLDKEYFHCLQEFAIRVHKKCDSGHYYFKDMNHAMDGAYEYLEVLRNSEQAHRSFNPQTARSHQN
jgi:AbiU2